MYTKVWLFGKLCLPLHHQHLVFTFNETNILSYGSVDNERFQKQLGNII